MKDLDSIRNGFDTAGGRECAPPFLAQLLADAEIIGHFDEDDLRENSKTGEIANIAGLAAHAIERPATEGLASVRACDGFAMEKTPQLPEGVVGPLAREIAKRPVISIIGTMGGTGTGASDDPVAVRVLCPQPYAHLAHGLRRMLWEPSASSEEDDQHCALASAPAISYTLLIWPEPVRRKYGPAIVEKLVGHWPGDGVGIAIGYDDPRLVADMLLDIGRRQWGARLKESGTGLIRIQAEGETACAEPFDSEQMISLFELPAASEPWVTDAAGGLMPVWRNPLLPAEALAGDRAWRRAALSVGSLAFDVEIDMEGRFVLFSDVDLAAEIEADAVDRPAASNSTAAADAVQADAGCFVVPRREFPAPFARQARRYPIA